MKNQRTTIFFWYGLAGLLLVVVGAMGSAAEATTSRPQPIEHFVVLMMENRSFDHLLGWLKKQNSEVNGLNGDEVNHVDPLDPLSPGIKVTTNASQVGDGDPPHEFDAQVQQIYGFYKEVDAAAPELMNGFVWAAQTANVSGTMPMSMFTSAPDSAPIINTLATEFSLFDAWHCSGTLPTDPNRGFAMYVQFILEFLLID